jgi:uncharacterized protein (DUF4415 family)
MSENDHDVDMRDEYDFSQARRGPILPPMAGKTRISIRIDNDVLEWFRDQVRNGGNYQTLMNHALRDYMSRAQADTQGMRSLQDLQPPTFLRRTQALPAQASTPSSPHSLTSQTFSEVLQELVRQVVREELERAK